MVRYRRRSVYFRKGCALSHWILQGRIVALTFMQANWLVNDALEKCTVDDLGAVVMDELHMIDDEHRGYLMELMATKLLTLQGKAQLIGMSATLSVSVRAYLFAKIRHFAKIRR